jgi:hypothetical protein
MGLYGAIIVLPAGARRVRVSPAVRSGRYGVDAAGKGISACPSPPTTTRRPATTANIAQFSEMDLNIHTQAEAQFARRATARPARPAAVSMSRLNPTTRCIS